jgi:copper(I)-binding protein
LVPIMMRKFAITRALLTCLSVSLLLSISSNSHGQNQLGVSAGELTVMDAWMPQPLQGARAGAIYLKIENKGSEADQLLGVESPIAKQVMVHESKESGGVMKMLPRRSMEIAPHAVVELKPMGIHLMAMGLNSGLKKPATFPVTLKFKRAGDVTVDVVVEASNALKPTSP